MARETALHPKDASLADILDHLGGISPKRIRFDPPPGRATEKDLIAILDHEDRLYELVEGTLVEKIMGYPESHVAMRLGRRLGAFAEDEHDLGIVGGADGIVRLMPKLVRIPDISFVSWKRLPTRECPSDPIPDLVPNLAAEVLSEGNTFKEIARKIKEYFFAGVELVWIVDPETRTVDVYTAPDQCVHLTENDTLDGGAVLPGFALPLRELFARVSREGRSRGKKKSGNGRKKR